MILEDIKIFIIDPEGEYDLLTSRLGGQTIDVGAALNSRINPFHIFGQMQEDIDKETTEEQRKENYKAIFFFSCSIFRAIFSKFNTRFD